MFNFEKLGVWQKANDFVDLVAVSISSIIGEGSSRSSKSDFVRFIEIATGFVFEVRSQAFVAQRQRCPRAHRFGELYANAEELSRMLNGLRKSLPSTLNSQL